MNGILFDLKNFRANQLHGMSQEDFAKVVGISQDKVSRMENDPTQVSLEVLMKIAENFGMSLDELVHLKMPEMEALNVDYTWSSPEFIRHTLLDYIEKSGMSTGLYARDVAELKTLVKKTLRKPKVAFIGRSDVGKSTMINTLLGLSRMPAHWTPTTAIAVYIKHVNDRPEYIEDDVWIFQSDVSTNEAWDDTRLSDEAYCRSLKLSGGNYDLLNTYGTRKGEHFAESKATAAVVFIDSSILLDCDIVDLPGYGTGDRDQDDALSLREKAKADVLVYMSIANGFMRSEDMSYIKDAIPGLPDIHSIEGAEIKPLANLFIVASQAHVIDHGNLEELDGILRDGCHRFESSLTDMFWEGRRKPESLVDRFYTYTSNRPDLCKRFRHDFCDLIEALPKVVEQRMKDLLDDWIRNKDEAVKTVISSYQQLLDDRKKCEDALREYDRNEPKRYSDYQNARRRISDRIAKYKSESRTEMSDFYERTITVENLVSLMEKRGTRNKKDDIQAFSTYVSGLLQDNANAVLKKKSDLLADDINEFLSNFEANAKISINSGAFNISTFNKESAFASGLVGVATYGALAIWAASCGNLGGYILIAKGVSLLSALGISVGGTAAAASAIAAIGGPVVLGIALAVITAIGAFAIFSGGWKKSIAKKIVEAYRKERALDKLQNKSDSYWNDTQTAFNAAAENLNREWNQHIESLRAQLRDYNVEAILKAKSEAEKMRNFLQNIPY